MMFKYSMEDVPLQVCTLRSEMVLENIDSIPLFVSVFIFYPLFQELKENCDQVVSALI